MQSSIPFPYAPFSQSLLWWLQKMPTRGSDAQQAENIGYGDSSPELFPSGHQSRLAMPRDWSSALNRRRSKGSGGSANGSCRKEQRQSQLKTDGEWFCESAASRAEKVRTNLGTWFLFSYPGVQLV